MARTADILGDRWTLLILREAFYGVQRYDDMLADLDASRAVLTDRLAKLVDQGLLMRRPYREEGSRTRFAYALTPMGRDTALILVAMMQWGEEHVTGEPAPVVVADAATGSELRVGLLHGADAGADPRAARLLPRARP